MILLITHREQLKKQEEMVARQEAMRRKTAEHEAGLRTKTELAKAKAEADAKIVAVAGEPAQSKDLLKQLSESAKEIH